LQTFMISRMFTDADRPEAVIALENQAYGQ